MITEKNHKLLISQLFVTDCTNKGLASMDIAESSIKHHKPNQINHIKQV